MKEQETDSSSPPESDRELLPKRVYIGEWIAIPFFVIAPLLLLFIGGGIWSSDKRFKKKYGFAPLKRRLGVYASVFMLGHLGSLFVYRTQRRYAIIDRLGFPRSGFQRTFTEEESISSRVIGLWAVLPLLLFVSSFIVPYPSLAYSLVSLGLWSVVVLNVLVAPVLVWYDVSKVKKHEYVDWGATWILFIFISMAPLGLLVYLAQRNDRLWYAAVAKHWETPIEEFEIPEEEKTRFEKLGDRLSAFA